MPLINVQLSNKELDNTEELLKSLSATLSKLSGKPECYVMTSLQKNVPMTFGGTSEPSCYIEIKSIGSIDSSSMTEQFCELISDRTGIKKDRIYIGFEDVPANLWGWNGRTFG